MKPFLKSIDWEKSAKTCHYRPLTNRHFQRLKISWFLYDQLQFYLYRCRLRFGYHDSTVTFATCLALHGRCCTTSRNPYVVVASTTKVQNELNWLWVQPDRWDKHLASYEPRRSRKDPLTMVTMQGRKSFELWTIIHRSHLPYDQSQQILDGCQVTNENEWMNEWTDTSLRYRHWRMCFERLLQAFTRWHPGILFDIAAQPILEYRWSDSYSQQSLRTQFKVATVYSIHTQSLSWCSTGLVPNVLPQRDEGSGKPCAVDRAS